MGSSGLPLLFDPGAVLPLRDGNLLVLDPQADQIFVIMEPQAGTILHRLITMIAAQPLINVFDDSGGLVREIKLPWSRRVLTSAEIGRLRLMHGAIASSLKPGPIGLTNHMISLNDTVFGIMVTDLWRPAEDPAPIDDQTRFKLFTTRGEYLGVVVRPEDFRILWQGSETLWVSALDEDGIPALKEVRLVRADKEG